MPALGLLVCVVFMSALSGCKSYGPIGTADFDPTYSRTLEKNEQLLFSSISGLMIGTYMEGEEELFPVYRGVLLLTSERLLFAIWNEKQHRYEPAIWTGYSQISKVKKHNNILLNYIAIVATDGSKFTYLPDKKNTDRANEILLERIRLKHNVPMQGDQQI